MEITSLSDINSNNGTSFILTNDIEIIDSYDSIDIFDDLQLDGDGYTIYYSGSDTWDGLFASKSNKTGIVIKNLNVILQSKDDFESGSQTFGKTSSNTGGFIGDTKGYSKSGIEISFSNCSFIGGLGYLSGGIYGYGAGADGQCTITNCYSICSMTTRGSGGIVGYNPGSYYSSLNLSNSDSYPDYYNCIITNCCSSFQFTGDDEFSNRYCGGITGAYAQNCKISNCFAIGEVSGLQSGGICASGIKTDISDCYVIGKVSGTLAGGIAGFMFSNSSITNCYVKGKIVGTGAGGVTGSMLSKTSDNLSHLASVTNCYTQSKSSQSIDEVKSALDDLGAEVEMDSYTITDNLNGDVSITSSYDWNQNDFDNINSNSAFLYNSGEAWELAVFTASPWCSYSFNTLPSLCDITSDETAISSAPTASSTPSATPTTSATSSSTSTISSIPSATSTISSTPSATSTISSIPSATPTVSSTSIVSNAPSAEPTVSSTPTISSVSDDISSEDESFNWEDSKWIFIGSGSVLLLIIIIILIFSGKRVK